MKTIALTIFLSFLCSVLFGDVIDTSPCVECKCGSSNGKNIACGNCQFYNSDWCQCNTDRKEICINDAIYELCTHSKHVMHVAKWHINEQEISNLKAEVEELRKMVEEMKEIDSDSWATWPGDIEMKDFVGHGPRCYCATNYEYRLQNPDKPKCYYWPNEQKEHCVIMPKDEELLKAEGWYCIDGIWYHEIKYKENIR